MLTHFADFCSAVPKVAMGSFRQAPIFLSVKEAVDEGIATTWATVVLFIVPCEITKSHPLRIVEFCIGIDVDTAGSRYNQS